MANATFTDTIGNLMLAHISDVCTKVSLHSGNPGKTGASQLTNLGYAKADATMNAPATQEITNDGEISFGPALENWVAATHFGLWNGATFLGGGALDAPRTITLGASATFADETLTLTL